ncbi:MAG: YfhO family protein, partial [Lachnospiraceae bacterium]|nr:YfhO family protein [Lachnospiraceae bacterium]
GLLGTLLAAFVLLPVVLRFLADSGAADDRTIPLLWPVSYYQNFLDSFLSSGSSALADSWTYMGFGATAGFCVLFVCAQWRKHRDQKAALVVLTALLLTPAAGYVLNGFSCPANRWMWAYALLIGTMTAAAVSEIAEAGVRQILSALALLALVAAACIGWHYTFSRESALSVVIALFGITAALLIRVMMLEKGRYSFGRYSYGLRVRAALLACVIVTIAAAGYFTYAPSAGAGVLEYLSGAQIGLLTSGDAAAAAELLGSGLSTGGGTAAGAGSGAEAADSEDAAASGASGGDRTVPFYRYTAFEPGTNTSILHGVSNTQYDWSLSNWDVSRFLSETGQLNAMINQYDTLDDRTALNEVVGIRYFLSDTPEGVPFGYEKMEGLSYSNADLWPENQSASRYSCEVYENKYALPLGFTTDRWMSRAEYNTLDIPQRQQALLQGLVLEQDPGEEFTELVPADSSRAGEAGTAQTVFSEQWIPAEIEYDKEMITEAKLETEDGSPMRFEAAEDNGSVTLRFAGLPDCETYLYVRGLHYTPPAGRTGDTGLLMSVDGFSGEKQCASKQIGYMTERDPRATGRTDFVVNMRYRAEALDRIRLSLPAAGTYTFDAIEVICQPMDAYPAMAEALGAQAMTDLDIHEMGESCATDRITGRVTVDAPRILCLQIPKTEGWTAYVDGQRTALMQADTMFSALPLTAGTHEIELRYQTPGLHMGAFISAGTLLLLILFTIVYAIVSAILRAVDRRREDLPEGSYESPAEEAPAEKAPAEKAVEDKAEEAPAAEAEV